MKVEMKKKTQHEKIQKKWKLKFASDRVINIQHGIKIKNEK